VGGSTPPKHVAIAILHRADCFLLQLRDDIPGIVFPGCWGFFGGHVEPGETPAVAVRRELVEEIGYATDALALFREYAYPEVVRHVFAGPLAVPPDRLVLGEGWDFGLASEADVRQGALYSERAGETRALAAPHRQILLDFLARARRASGGE